MNEKYTLEGDFQVLLAKAELEVKRSKFICYVYNINSENQINNILNNIRVTNKDAKHVVYAYRFENSGRYTDDKEPSNTAGKPIYAMLEKEKLVNILVVVVRYFGGILLGTGPLTRAYLGVASSAILKCVKIQYIKYQNKEYVVEYSDEKNVLKEIENEKGIVVNIKYDDKVRILAKIPDEK